MRFAVPLTRAVSLTQAVAAFRAAIVAPVTEAAASDAPTAEAPPVDAPAQDAPAGGGAAAAIDLGGDLVLKRPLVKGTASHLVERFNRARTRLKGALGGRRLSVWRRNSVTQDPDDDSAPGAATGVGRGGMMLDGAAIHLDKSGHAEGVRRSSVQLTSSHLTRRGSVEEVRSHFKEPKKLKFEDFQVVRGLGEGGFGKVGGGRRRRPPLAY
jgi:hypothetical protein